MKKLVSLFLLLIVLAVSSCSSVPVDETQFPAGIVPGEYQNAAIIIFDAWAPPLPSDDITDEEYIVSCLENRIKKQNPDQSFISYNQFANTMFPDLPDFDVPREPESFPRLLADEKFYKDVLSWGVRYLIFVRGSTGSVKAGGDIIIDWWPGFWGFAYWDNKTQLAASVLDLHQKETAANNIENTSEDTSWLAVAAVVPVGSLRRLQNLIPVRMWAIVWARFYWIGLSNKYILDWSN